ncbi:MAG: hypothetical protein EXR51_01080 [Dehalococcoidia bacterium]|nr:hypothetical protein [Dehalococcoidia bacterium]
MARSNYINPLLRRTDAGNENPASQPHLLNVQPLQPPAVAVAVHPVVPANPVGPKPVQPPIPISQPPVKFTFYFLPEQLRRLDNLWVRSKLDHRERLNKSEFVRLALDRLMERFDQDPKEVLDDLKRHRSSAAAES